MARPNFPASWLEHDRKVKPYLWSHRVIGWFSKALGLFLLFYLFSVPRAQILESYLSQRFDGGFALWLVYFGILGASWEILSFPFSLLSYYVERYYGLSRQNFGAWFWDKVKGWLVGGILGALVLLLIYGAVSYSVTYWWLIASVLMFLVSVVLAQLAPVLLLPIFFKMKPMEPSELKERLLNLCKRFQIEVKEIYHLGLGEKTEKGNAAFMGLGKTKRIVIGDTLYEKFPADQVEAVFAHELGHQVHNDLWKGLALSTVILVLSFYLANLVTVNWILPRLGLDYLHVTAIFIFFIVLSLIQIPFGVVQAAFSRQRERMADDFALSKIGCGAQLADALEKLTQQNWGLYYPLPIVEWWGHSHPAPWRRIQKMRS